MSTTEAATLLAECKPLCDKLNALGLGSEVDVNCELDKEDMPLLWNFYKVSKAGFGYSDTVRQAAGLKRGDLSLLNYMLACQL